MRRLLVIVDGTLVKSCMMLAVQADGATIERSRGSPTGGELSPLQQAFATTRAAVRLLHAGDADERDRCCATNPSPTDDEIKKALQGNICRCTGYWNIFEAVKTPPGPRSIDA